MADKPADDAAVDSNYLLALARKKSKQSRSELAKMVAAFFNTGSDELNDRARSLIYDILHQVIADVENSVRHNLSEVLSEQDTAPRDLLRFLGNDEFAVAEPILLHSQVLMDEDLIEIIRHRTLEHQMAIAARRNISSDLSHELALTGEESVILRLLHNGDSDISRQTMEYLVEKSRTMSSIQEPIVRRNDLDEDLARKMVFWVSAALRSYILETWRLDPALVDEALEKTIIKERRLYELAGRKFVPGQDLISTLMATQEDRMQLLVAALHEGEVPLFISMFRQVSGLRARLVRRILFEPGGEGLAIACRAIGLNRDAYGDIYVLSRMARAGAGEDIATDPEPKTALDFFDSVTHEAAERVVKLWSRGTDFLSAVRELQLSGDRGK
ncbi:DUF2336 domain-containing protein [Magnetospira sp. QH-2]|uniref:DUF2336 domain-containing protein n=1 Tax=Magnetospira sp. (strain QH-2) TaxID=1288970 RepID=UPI0003E8123D|nr:DUF2336 domain-containing protein [Magnetospira sp. QH-2]CCQ74694.1 conserved protein of unknown function [Magnetospira sp. QH-2]